MFPLGFFLVALGAYLVDCAIKNRAPVKTLEAIIRDPKHMRETLGHSSGTGYVPHPSHVPGSGSGSLAGLLNPNDVLGASAAALLAVQWARTQIGKPYVYGATGPNAYDCSGLVCQAYAGKRKDGSTGPDIALPRTTFLQLTVGKRVSEADLRIGDLVFPDPGHVQLYSGNGNVIESPHTGLDVREVKMWGFMTARRVA